MANRAYVSLWSKGFSEATMLEQFQQLLTTVPLSAEGPGCELGAGHAEWLQREAPSLEAWLARWLEGESLPHRPRGPWGGR